jgi:alanyl-tRNA synthetase
MSKTDKLYQKNVYLKECDQTLLSLEEGDLLKVSFDSTIFFPEGGGQLCDTGIIAGHRVVDVQEDKTSGIIFHNLEKDGDKLEIGKSYKAILDWDRRFSHMQMHCGEHLISGAFYKLFGAQNKGFHMGDDYVTIDIDWNGKEMSPDMIADAEMLANSWVCQDIPVETRWFDTAKEAMSLPCRKDIKAGKDISVVLIGDEKDPADCCACCGTHPVSTGQIGIIKIVHREKYKAMNRFYVKCGAQALSDYTNKQSILSTISKKYSCDINDLEKALEAADAREKDIYRKYSSLKGYYLNAEEEAVRKQLALPKEKSIRVFRYEQFDINDLQNMARKLENDIRDVTVFVSVKENSCLITSDGSTDCGKLVKDNASIYGGKGGGKPKIARAIFDSKENLELYLDLIEKHLR